MSLVTRTFAFQKWFAVAALAAVQCSVASADILLVTTSTLTNADPFQAGRLSRNGVPQDWSGSEPYPGSINPGIQYHYQTFNVNVGTTPFIQISMDDVSPVEFVSAYSSPYNPASLSTGWLGDAGLSGNAFGVDPVFFQVIAPAFNSVLTIVVNNTSGGALPGNNGTFTLTVEGFEDSSFTSTPEPATAVLSAAALGFLGLAGLKRRRTAAASSRA